MPQVKNTRNTCISNHYIKGATGIGIRKAAEDVNKLFLEGHIPLELAKRLKSDILSFVVVSHKPVVANLFSF